MTYEVRTCEHCSKEYHKPTKLSPKAWLEQRYCSKTCSGLARKITTDSHICKHCKTVFNRKLHTSVSAWESVVFCSRACADADRDTSHLEPHQFTTGNMSGVRFTSEITTGELNNNWKGDEAGYAAKHIWVANHFGRPKECEHCGTTEDRRYHWANVSGKYTRERSDWLRLCVPCHKKYDLAKVGGKIKAREPIPQPSKVCPECGITFFKNPRFSKTQWEEKERCGRACSSKEIARQKFRVNQPDGKPLSKICIKCGKEYFKAIYGTSIADWNKRQYCDRKCGSEATSKARTGVKESEAVRKIRSAGQIKRHAKRHATN